VLAATINLNIEFQAITFIQRAHARAFNRRDMDECIRLPIVALNKAKALHRVEELHRARGRFTGQLALWRTAISAAKAATITATFRTVTAVPRRAAIFYWKRIAINDQVCCRNLATAIHKREAERLTFCQSGQASLFNCGDVNEHIFAAFITGDEAKALLTIEKLDDTFAFANDLSWHAGASATCTTAAETSAATATETIAAAEAITATATAKTVAATKAAATAETITAAEAATAKIVIAKTVAFVSAAPATITAASSIKTHARNYFLQSSTSSKHKNLRAGRQPQTLRRKIHYASESRYPKIGKSASKFAFLGLRSKEEGLRVRHRCPLLRIHERQDNANEGPKPDKRQDQKTNQDDQ
jgi:hypothetical protein